MADLVPDSIYAFSRFYILGTVGRTIGAKGPPRSLAEGEGAPRGESSDCDSLFFGLAFGGLWKGVT